MRTAKRTSHSRFLRDRTRPGKSVELSQEHSFFIDDCCRFTFSWSCEARFGLSLTLFARQRVARKMSDPALCGPYPKNYKEIVWNWTARSHCSMPTARAKSNGKGDPKPADLGKKRRSIFTAGWSSFASTLVIALASTPANNPTAR